MQGSRLARLRDHVIVCGYGRTGKQVVEELEQGTASLWSSSR